MKRLILIPTYNEKENVPKLYQELRALNLDFDILFVDDNSPDGTGQIIRDLAAKDPGVFSLHREGKSGVGSAHKAGIYWAYERGYDELISMDCDFTHPPKAIFEILKFSGKVDVAVASRYMIDNSLEEWNPFRKFLTNFGHLMTKYLLGIPFDATGGFRLYDLKKVPKEIFQMVESNGYSFFFESLFVLHKNHFCIGEFPICLPARTYGHSKMTINEIFSSVKRLVQLSQIVYLHTDKYKFSHSLDRRDLDPSLVDVQNWDQYWNTEKSMGGPVYDLIARFYRRFIIRPNLNRFVRRHFAQGAHVLHAGCGSGQVDQDIRNAVDITGLDISVNALWQYKRHNGNLCGVLHGSIFNLPLAENSIDGVYNLGVMEHFSETEISQILSEIRRVLKPGGKFIAFWPPRFGASVLFLKGVRFVLEKVFAKKNVKLHPDEISLVQSRKQVEQVFEAAGFQVVDYSFGWRDLFTYSIIVGQKVQPASVSTSKSKQVGTNRQADRIQLVDSTQANLAR